MPEHPLLSALRDLLPSGCGAAWTNPREERESSPADLSPAATPSRMREFAAGRAAARMAMQDIGVNATSIPSGPDRAPVWPEDILGSITHTTRHCLAAVAPKGALSGLGIDLEEASPLERSLWDTILLATEQRALMAFPHADRGLMAKVAFCAKEAAYKAQYPTSRTLFGFDAMTVTIEGNHFAARFLHGIPPFAGGHIIEGRFTLSDDHILAVATL